MSSPTAGVQTPPLTAVVPHVALLAEAGAIGASPLPRTVPGAPQLAAVLACVGLFTDTLSIHAEPPGAAVCRAPELGAVTPAVLAVTDALAIHTHAPAGAAQRTVGLRAVLAEPAFIADAAAGLEAEVAVTAAVRDVVQLSWNSQGGGQRAAVAPPVSGTRGGVDRDHSSLSGQICVADSQAQPSLVHIQFCNYFHLIWVACV